jgi:hypothetical protein
MKTFTRLLIAALTCMAAKTSPEPPKSVPKRADISISGIFLNDPASAEKVLGKEIPMNGEHVAYWNSDRTQLLTLFFHSGDEVHSFSEIKVNQAGKSESAIKVLSFPAFITGKGVRLGITEKQLTAIFGKGLKERVGSQSIIRYKIEDTSLSSSPFLQHYRMPSYYGEYRYEGGKLVEFRFGFEYP